jgi:L-alanine-DL-glutamate epimerase-like enolase superfamily enzyme
MEGRPETGISKVDVSTFTVPLDAPESDGTLTWDSTTVVVVEAAAAGERGLGFTYGPAACATLIRDTLALQVTGVDVMDVPAAWGAMVRSIRNMGRPGIASMAIAAVDTSLWDLKAKLLGLPLARLLGAVRDHVPVYGSGGFTSWTEGQLADQLGSWVHKDGIPAVKMKIGTDWGTDDRRDICPVCGQAFENQEELRKHQDEQHPESDRPGGHRDRCGLVAAPISA